MEYKVSALTYLYVNCRRHFDNFSLAYDKNIYDYLDGTLVLTVDGNCSQCPVLFLLNVKSCQKRSITHKSFVTSQHDEFNLKRVCENYKKIIGNIRHFKQMNGHYVNIEKIKYYLLTDAKIEECITNTRTHCPQFLNIGSKETFLHNEEGMGHIYVYLNNQFLYSFINDSFCLVHGCTIDTFQESVRKELEETLVISGKESFEAVKLLESKIAKWLDSVEETSKKSAYLTKDSNIWWDLILRRIEAFDEMWNRFLNADSELKSNRKSETLQVQEFALNYLFEKDLLQQIGIGDLQSITPDMSVRKLVDDRLKFEHRIHYEYLAAVWSFNNISKCGKFFENAIFRKEMDFYLAALNYLLCQGHVLHQAVLMNDVDRVSSVLRDNRKSVLEVNEAGMTAGHLAVLFDRDNVLSLILTSQKRSEVSIVKDTLLGWTIGDYAMKLEKWHMLDILTQHLGSEQLNDCFLKCQDLHKLWVNACINGYTSLLYHVLCREPSAVTWPVDEKGRSAVSVAIMRGYDQVLQILTEHGADLNAVDKTGSTPLHEAALCGDCKVVKFLIDRGVQVDAKNKANSTPLIYAVISGESEVVKMLINSGADVNTFVNMYEEELINCYQHASFIDTAIGLATSLGYAPIIDALVAGGADPNTTDYDFRTPLHDAASVGNCEALASLIAAGADINILGDCDNRSPLSFAAEKGHLEAVKMLFAAGAELCEEEHPLFFAALNGHTDIVLFLLKSLSKDTWEASHVTPLILATKAGNLEVLKAMVSEGIDTEGIDGDGRTAFHHAVTLKSVEIMEFFLQIGLQTDVCDKDGNTAFHLAAQSGAPEIVKLLLDKGLFTVDSLNGGGLTALHLAASYGCLEKDRRNAVVDILLKYGANVNAQDGKGCSALHYTAGNADLKTLETLVSAGANSRLKDKEGRSALHYAAASISQEATGMAAFLIQLGLQPNEKDNCGITPLHLAVEKACPEVIEMFLQQEQVDVDVQDDHGMTPLMFIASYKWNFFCRPIKIIEALLSQGPQLDIRNKDGKTAFQLAAETENRQMLEALSRVGKKVSDLGKEDLNAWFLKVAMKDLELSKVLVSAGADIKSKCADGSTALHVVPYDANEDCIKHLLHLGLSLHTEDCRGQTPLHAAARAGCLGAVKTLIENSDKEIINKKDKKGCTALVLILKHSCRNMLEITKALIEAGCDISSTDNEGRTALDIAAEKSYFMVVETLLSAGASLQTIKPDTKIRFLHWASEKNDCELVESLIAVGTDPEATDNEGQTALHHAAMAEGPEVLKKLLDTGWSANTRDGKGRSLLHTAACHGGVAVIKYLVQECQLDANDKDLQGLTPLMLQAQSWKRDRGPVAEALLAAGADCRILDSDGNTVLELARKNGNAGVVRAIRNFLKS